MKWIPGAPLDFAGRRPWATAAGVVLTLLVISGVVLLIFPGRFAPEKKPAPPSGPAAPVAEDGKSLYANYCAGCHGERGDGNGPAARFLYPRPRNFGEGKFRVVTTANRIPSDEDLFGVITRGMPGSAMFPFGHLSEAERHALVGHVRGLIRAGVEERVRREMTQGGSEPDADEFAEALDRLTKPGEPLAVPELPAADPGSLARGAATYRELCAPCHGTTGKGDGMQAQRDDSGMPIRPRDFTRGIFKSGRRPQDLYARIVLGLPGSPMPASSNLKPSQVSDLINYVLSLSPPGADAGVEHQRRLLAARKCATTFSEEIPEESWKSAPPASVVVSPLWWREYLPPGLEVRALHDGRTLALRLTWKDRTPNATAVRPQDFEDMAAVQLFKGAREPFLGMGAADKNVDVWLWHPGGQAAPGAFADVDTAYPNMAVDSYPFEKPGKGRRPHAPEDQPKEFITARAAGNLRSDPARPFTGNNLQAGGFGTLTMRPRVSQAVSARGAWKDGRWTVILRRPLEVGPDAGLPLAVGDKLSIAFAIWDGAARDRNGQKLVSIWHDLRLEP